MDHQHQHQQDSSLWTQRFTGHPYRSDWSQTTYTTPTGVATLPTLHSTYQATDLYTLVELTADHAVYQWYATAPHELLGLLRLHATNSEVPADD